MKLKFILLGVLFIVFLTSKLSFAQGSTYVPGELLIAPQQGVSDSQLESLYNSYGGKKINVLHQINVHHIKVPNKSLDSIEKALSKNPNTKFVEKNFIAKTNLVPDDPGLGNQWYLQTISAPSGWDISIGSSTVTIAVIDSGVDPSHPDLAAKLVPGWNFLGGNTDTHDVFGHGTAVSGVAAANTNNGVGIAGVGWANTIMPLVVVNSSGSATYADIASAVNYAADHGAKVINMSLGGTSPSSTLQSAVNYAWGKGLVIVAAAGNCSCNTPSYPAAMDNVIAVSATDSSDNLASFSSYGSFVDVAAPGTPIYTTDNGGGYGSWQGTSFSTPQVAGLAALIFSINSNLSNTQIVDLITMNADDLGTVGYDDSYGWGRINNSRTLGAAQTVVPPPPPPADTTPPQIVNSSVSYDGKFVTASASVTDSESGVAKVDFLLDGIVKSTDTAAPYSFKINAKPWPKGVHTINLRATDNAGNSSLSPNFTITK